MPSIATLEEDLSAFRRLELGDDDQDTAHHRYDEGGMGTIPGSAPKREPTLLKRGKSKLLPLDSSNHLGNEGGDIIDNRYSYLGEEQEAANRVVQGKGGTSHEEATNNDAATSETTMRGRRGKDDDAKGKAPALLRDLASENLKKFIDILEDEEEGEE
eukprot:jgi/Bigna1/91838/estExt_fgenesh1_pg.C_1230018